MRSRSMLIAGVVVALTLPMFIRAQDAPSLGDLARQQRQQREQSKATQPKVFTNADLPQHSDPSAEEIGDSAKAPLPIPTDSAKQSSDHIRSEIQDEKNRIASLQMKIDEVNGSIRFASANCVRNCVAWNERQERKQQEMERMRAELSEHQSQLQQMQDAARKLGFGSKVYDP